MVDFRTALDATLTGAVEASTGPSLGNAIAGNLYNPSATGYSTLDLGAVFNIVSKEYALDLPGDAEFFDNIASIESGSSTLNITGLVGSSSYVGMKVQVRGAGVAGAELIATITASGSGYVTLDIPASTMVSSAKAAIGTDVTAKLQNALLRGLSRLPVGGHLFSAGLYTDLQGAGLLAENDSTIITLANLDRPISVIVGTKGTQWRNFQSVGPYRPDLQYRNRLLTIGMQANLVDIADSHWDASGTFAEFDGAGWGALLHFAQSDYANFGVMRGRDINHSAPDLANVGYGITCSASHVRGRKMEIINANGVGRHAVYWNGDSDDCFVDYIYAKGYDLNPFQSRIRGDGVGGRDNGFGIAYFEDCNTSPGNFGGTVNFLIAANPAGDQSPSPNAVTARAKFNKVTLVNCGGKAVTCFGYADSDLGDVHVVGHAGYGSATEKYLVEINSLTYNTTPPATRRADGTNLRSLTVSGLNNNTVTAVRVRNTTGSNIGPIQVNGVYQQMVEVSGTSDAVSVGPLIPVTIPTGLLASDTSTAARAKWITSPGTDSVTISDNSDTTPSVAGYSTVLLNYSAAALVTFFDDAPDGQILDVISLTANATLVHNTSAGGITLNTGANIALGTRGYVRLRKFGTRWIQAK